MPASIRQQVVPGTAPYLDGAGGGNVSLGRSTLFGTLYLKTNGVPKPVGGMQAFSIEETNETQFRTMAGNDWLEPVYGKRSWSGNGSRFQIRGQDLQEMLADEYVGLSDIDFRFCPFIWQYNFLYQSPNGQVTIENAQWSWMTIFITSYRTSFADPFSLISEDFSFIGKGAHRTDGANKYSLSTAHNLWGAGTFVGGGATAAGSGGGAGGGIGTGLPPGIGTIGGPGITNPFGNEERNGPVPHS